MNTPECKFEDYLNKNDLHPKIVDKLKKIVNKEEISKNLIIYGPEGVGRYTLALNYASYFSPSNLNYEKKAIVETNKGQIVLKLSDIHFEVDLALLGCNSKQIWNEIYLHIINIVEARNLKKGIIICKNFDKIHSELLDVFYSYMQTTFRQTKISFILITDCVGFLPTRVLKRCHMISVARPSKTAYSKVNKLSKMFDVTEIDNIKVMGMSVESKGSKYITSQILNLLVDLEKFDFDELRKLIYEIFVRNINIMGIIWDLVTRLLDNHIDDKHSLSIIQQTYIFVQLFNNNYRPIYHLERYLCFLLIKIHELQ